MALPPKVKHSYSNPSRENDSALPRQSKRSVTIAWDTLRMGKEIVEIRSAHCIPGWVMDKRHVQIELCQGKSQRLLIERIPLKQRTRKLRSCNEHKIPDLGQTFRYCPALGQGNRFTGS
jgi:hypothetical protein